MESPLVSGFTFIKNGLSLGYPFKESIESIEPLCDEIIINVGFDDEGLINDDGTYEYLKDYFSHPKFKFMKSHWDPSLREGGLILSQQTNLALAACQGKICQYIQGDEVIHEDDLPAIHNAYIEMIDKPEIEGLVFNYIHFYGNVNIYKYTRNIYRREVRAIRNGLGIKSWKDAQGFRYSETNKITAKRIDARIMHYGWARQEQVMRKKIESFEKLYHSDGELEKNSGKNSEFQYDNIWGLKEFTKTHPAHMKNWIENNKNDLDILSMKYKFNFNNIGLAISDWIENLTDYRIGEYRNYKLIC